MLFCERRTKTGRQLAANVSILPALEWEYTACVFDAQEDIAGGA